MEVVVIAAVAENGAIGKDGDVPWKIPEDMKHFKQKTTGHPVIMGRKTFESLPDDYKPLPDRTNIVLTRSGFEPEDGEVKVTNSLEEAYQEAEKLDEKTFVIGGSSVYEAALEDADKMIITEVHREVDGDTFFPEWKEENWEEVKRDEREGFSFVEYQRT
jgi:dihydrofolate reductase